MRYARLNFAIYKKLWPVFTVIQYAGQARKFRCKSLRYSETTAARIYIHVYLSSPCDDKYSCRARNERPPLPRTIIRPSLFARFLFIARRPRSRAYLYTRERKGGNEIRLLEEPERKRELFRGLSQAASAACLFLLRFDNCLSRCRSSALSLSLFFRQRREE